jgi:hypothetical protein
MKRKLKLMALLAALAATPAAAHEKGDRARGVVESVSAERIVIESADGHMVAFAITEETRFFRGGELAGREDVKPGQRAVVHGKRSGEELRAVQVKLGAAPARR